MTRTDELFSDAFLQPPAGDPARFGGRWRLTGVGLSNVWRYGNLVLDAGSGRLLMRGLNGTGKTTALEALWPFLLDLDRAKLAAGKSRNTTLTALMGEGWEDRKRVGYVWATFVGPGDEGIRSYGARLQFTRGANPPVKIVPFTLPGEPLRDMPLTEDGSSAITTVEAFRETVETAGGQVFDTPDEYVTDLGATLLDASRQDVIALADRIRVVRNPSLLAAQTPAQAAEAVREALPTVPADVIDSTANALVATEETRSTFEKNRQVAEALTEFADVWTGHVVEATKSLHGAAVEARTEQTRLLGALRKARSAHDQAVAEKTSATQAREALRERLARAEVQVAAIRADDAYQDIGRLRDLQETAIAKADVAESKLDLLKERATNLQTAGSRLTDVVENLRADLEDVITSVTEAAPDARENAPVVVLTRRPRAVISVGDTAVDPGPDLQVTADPQEFASAAGAWTRRSHEHFSRAGTIKGLIREHRHVAEAHDDLVRTDKAAGEAQSRADQAEQKRTRTGEEAAAAVRRLAVKIGEWAARHGNLLAPDDDADQWSGADLADITALEPAEALAVAAQTQARAQRAAERVAATAEQSASHLSDEAGRLRAEAGEHRHQASRLRSGQLLPLPRPEWAGPGDDTRALGAAIDWADEAPESRDLIEAALAAAGLLGATLTVAGAETHTWQVAPLGPVPDINLHTLLEVDESHPLAQVASGVLARVELADTAADGTGTLVIGRDGTFRAGVLHGRAPGCDDSTLLAPAAHIGARQRREAAHARADMLEAQADELDTAAQGLNDEAITLRQHATGVRRDAAQFPPATALEKAERERVLQALETVRAMEAAARAEQDANEARARAAAATHEWRTRATSAGLPADLDELRTLEEQSVTAGTALEVAAKDVAGRLRHTVSAIIDEQAEVNARAADLDGFRAAATTAHMAAQRTRLELETHQAAKGQTVADLLARLEAANGELTECKESQSSAEGRYDEALQREAATSEAARTADRAVQEQAPRVHAAVAALRTVVTRPGVGLAILGDAAAAEDDLTLLTQVKDALEGRRTYTVPTLRKVYDGVRGTVTGSWTVDLEADKPVETYRLTQDGNTYTPLSAARHAETLRARAEAQLHQAEEAVLRDFIVHQLPKAIGTAWRTQRDWVVDVNRKMLHASASSGVGVQIKTSLSANLSPHQRTVYELACMKSLADRTQAEEAALGEALNALITAAAGESVHDRVRSAVNVREWVEVEYNVLRPGQEKLQRWTSKAGLSGGERRLVVLAPMLAAVAAVYDNLPEYALRLVALDEVPVEVDEHGREGLARYIAHLDLDLICTSYLWDGAPGAWDGIDAWDLEEAFGVVVGNPMAIRGLLPVPGDPDYDGRAK